MEIDYELLTLHSAMVAEDVFDKRNKTTTKPLSQELIGLEA